MPEPLAVSFGRAVRAARQRAQLTQEQVAHAVELPLEAYGRMEHGVLLPSIQTLVRLSRVLRTPIDALLSQALSEPSQPPSTS
jgi:transcriptional regulator with XRE-family HTH domain